MHAVPVIIMRITQPPYLKQYITPQMPLITRQPDIVGISKRYHVTYAATP